MHFPTRKLIFTVLSICSPTVLLFAQQISPDTSLAEIAPIEIKAHFNAQAMLDLTSSARVVSHKLLNAQNSTSILSGMNSTPGIRMEERSPGSYRLAMRGSMIRSPFGVRNTKIYLDEIPFTDASGNTYLNLLDPVGIEHIQVLKKAPMALYMPQYRRRGSHYPFGLDLQKREEKSLLLSGGSYGQFHEQLTFAHQVNKNYHFSLIKPIYAPMATDSRAHWIKKFIQTAHQWNYNERGQLKILALYSDLGYETPGGLTEQQYHDNPAQARPAGGPFPSAADRKRLFTIKQVWPASPIPTASATIYRMC